jgi:hypothetical protein
LEDLFAMPPEYMPHMIQYLESCVDPTQLSTESLQAQVDDFYQYELHGGTAPSVALLLMAMYAYRLYKSLGLPNPVGFGFTYKGFAFTLKATETTQQSTYTLLWQDLFSQRHLFLQQPASEQDPYEAMVKLLNRQKDALREKLQQVSDITRLLNCHAAVKGN